MPSYSLTLFSLREQAKFARALYKVGGYDELIRLDREVRAIRRAGHKPKLVRDPVTKKYTAEIAAE